MMNQNRQFAEFCNEYQMKGDLDIKLINAETKKVVERRQIKNTIVDGGEIWIAELLAGEELGGSTLSYAAGELGHGFQYVHVGNSGTATTQGMFKLQDYSSITGNYYKSTTNDVQSPGNVIVVSANFATNEGNGDIKEAGVFSSTSTTMAAKTDTGGRMFNRTTFASINKTTAFTLALQWTVTIGTV